MSIKSLLLLPLVAALLSACNSDPEAPADSGMQADAVLPGEAGPPRDHGAGEGVVDDASFDAGADAATPSGTYNPVGTPTATSAGRGGPPTVAWPKPAYAHPQVPFEFTMVAWDAEHDRLIFSLRNSPAGMSIDVNGTIRWTPAAGGGPHAFFVDVDDGRGKPVTVPVKLSVDASKFLFVAPGGSDKNPGTLAAPLADVDLALRKLTGRSSGTLYLRGGTYAIAWNWESGGVTSPFRNTKGSPDAPYVVRGYPGEKPILDCGGKGHGIWSYGGSYTLHADLEIRGAARSERAGAIIGGSNNVLQNITVRDSDWASSSNCTGFQIAGNNSICHRCRGIDNYDRSSGHWNSSNFLVYTDKGSSSAIYIIDSYSEGSICGFKMKHAGVGRLVLHGSRDKGSDYGWAGIDDKTTIRFNTFEQNKIGLGIGISDPNSYTMGELLLEYNTVVGAKMAFSISDGYGKGKGVTLQRNVLTIAGAPGSGENAPHLGWVWPWQSAPAVSILSSDKNCWWGSSSSAGFRFGKQELGFNGWQALGFDAGSRFADPTFVGKTYALAANSGCFKASARVGAWE